MHESNAIANALMSGAMLMSSDLAWRDFGFRRHPRQLPWHRRILRGRAREIEVRIARILFCSAIATHIKSGRLATADGVQAVNASVANPECVRLLGLQSEPDAASHLACLVLDLAECETTRWGRVLAHWLDLPSIDNAAQRTQLAHGTLVLAASLRQTIHALMIASRRTAVPTSFNQAEDVREDAPPVAERADRRRPKRTF